MKEKCGTLFNIKWQFNVNNRQQKAKMIKQKRRNISLNEMSNTIK